MKGDKINKTARTLFVVLSLVLSVGSFFVGFVGAEENSLLEDDLLRLSVGEESGFLNFYGGLNLKLISLSQDSCNEEVSCLQNAEILITFNTKPGVAKKQVNLTEQESVEMYGVNIKLVSIDNNIANFRLSDVPPTPTNDCEKYYTCPDGSQVQYCWNSVSKYDLNNDRIVDNSDLIVLRIALGKYDFDGDGVIDDDDAEVIDDYINKGDICGEQPDGSIISCVTTSQNIYDLNGDGKVDNEDIEYFKAKIFDRYNFNGDDKVDVKDITIVSEHRGETSACSCIENPASLCVKPEEPVCGNGKCEAGEGMICDAVIQNACEVGKICEVLPVKCKIICPEDCESPEERNVVLNEKFKMDVGDSVKVKDYSDMKIKFSSIAQTKCAVREIYEKSPIISKSVEGVMQSPSEETYSIRTSEKIIANDYTQSSSEETETGNVMTKCLDGEIIAELIVTVEEEPTTYVNIKLGERKEVFGVTFSFLDYYSNGRTGVFLISDGDYTDCPKECICSADGTTTCPSERECDEGTILCPDGKCKEECEITNEKECKFGCLYGGSCLPIGTRVEGKFCDIGRDLTEQLGDEGTCENNFECGSNVCVNGKCISGGLLEKILDWFKKLFG